MSKNKDIKKQGWSMIIKPKKHLLDFNMKELWEYKDLIYLFFRRDFVAKYKQTVLGPLWFLIQPVLTTITFVVIFGNIAGISTDGLPKVLFYMTGVIGWTYFSLVLKETSVTFRKNSNIFGKVYFPRLSVPISVTISNLVTFCIQFALLVGFMVYFWAIGANFAPNWYVLLLPVLIMLLAGLGLGFGILLSAMTTKYRDLINLLDFGIQLWMYATPIVYPVSTIPQKYKLFILINPVTPIVETFRYSLLGTGHFNPVHLLYSFGFMVVLLFVGIIVFNKVERTFMDTV